MARPTKYTPALAQKICDGLKEGLTRKAACGCAGIDVASFARWLERFADFAVSVTHAEAQAEEKMTSAIFKAATADTYRDWRAAESWLKRRRREDWGDRADVHSYDMSQFDDAELDMIAAGENIDRVLAIAGRRRAGAPKAGAAETTGPGPPPVAA